MILSICIDNKPLQINGIIIVWYILYSTVLPNYIVYKILNYRFK